MLTTWDGWNFHHCILGVPIGGVSPSPPFLLLVTACNNRQLHLLSRLLGGVGQHKQVELISEWDFVALFPLLSHQDLSVEALIVTDSHR